MKWINYGPLIMFKGRLAYYLLIEFLATKHTINTRLHQTQLTYCSRI